MANLKRRLTKGLLFGAAYTWSKSLDYASSNGTNIVNAYNNSIMYGPSDFDTRHVFVANYVWDIPFASHASNLFVRALFGDWQTSGTIQAQSGRPPSNGISTGLRTGPLTCSSTLAARPSQNCTNWAAAL